MGGKDSASAKGEDQRPRRRGAPSQPQQERSAETRMRLIEATVECLAKYGFSNTSTLLIAKTAGVTRGAYLHHFGSREQLITEALGYILDTAMADIEKRIVGLFRDGRQGEVLDQIWKSGFQDWMFAGLEMLLRCRRDPELQRFWASHSAKFNAWRRRAFSEMLGREIVDDSELLCLIDGFLDILRGMAIMEVLRTKSATNAQLTFWRGVFEREVTRILDEARMSSPPPGAGSK